MATCGDKEIVEDYAVCLNSLAAHLATLGKVVKETQIVEKMLHGLPSWFKHVTIAIKTLLDVSMMNVADLTGHLKEAEEAFKEPPDMMQHEGKLYLMVEEWYAWWKKRKAANGLDGRSSSGSSRGRGCRGRGRGHGGGRNGSRSGLGKPTGDECRRWGKLGHWAQEGAG
jgi:hypothetical protein